MKAHLIAASIVSMITFAIAGAAFNIQSLVNVALGLLLVAAAAVVYFCIWDIARTWND